MVDVPVHDRYPLDEAGIDGCHHPEADVVEDAEPAAAVAFGVVAGWAHERVGVVDVATSHRGDGRGGAADAEACDLGRTPPDRCVLAGVAAVASAQLVDEGDVPRGVEPVQVLVGGLTEVEVVELRRDLVGVEQVLQLALGLGVLDVHARLEVARHLVGARRRPVEVPHQSFVPDEPGPGHGPTTYRRLRAA